MLLPDSILRIVVKTFTKKSRDQDRHLVTEVLRSRPWLKMNSSALGFEALILEITVGILYMESIAS